MVVLSLLIFSKLIFQNIRNDEVHDKLIFLDYPILATAILYEILQQAIHDLVISPANQAAAVALLGKKSSVYQFAEMV